MGIFGSCCPILASITREMEIDSSHILSTMTTMMGKNVNTRLFCACGHVARSSKDKRESGKDANKTIRRECQLQVAFTVLLFFVFVVVLITPNVFLQMTTGGATKSATPGAVVPDGGWGWIIVFASLMIHFIMDGFVLSFRLVCLRMHCSGYLE